MSTDNNNLPGKPLTLIIGFSLLTLFGVVVYIGWQAFVWLVEHLPGW